MGGSVAPEPDLVTSTYEFTMVTVKQISMRRIDLKE